MMTNSQREILITCALPYANGNIHLGHMLEHIQADIWARFQRGLGNKLTFICADDAHGTPIMINAEKLGLTPEQMIAQSKESHIRDFAGFGISFDNYHSTHSVENKEIVNNIYKLLKEKDLISRKTISQYFDEQKQMFLPDRFIKGTCPACKAADQYGDNCESCGKTYSTSDLINPYSVVSGAKPIMKDTEHLFFELPKLSAVLEKWITSGAIGGEVRNQMMTWFEQGLVAWDISRDAPYFGFEIEGEKDKYFYVWVDAPVGYISSYKNYCDKQGFDYQKAWDKNASTELYHFIGKDIMYFHTLFWPAMLEGADLKKPDGVFVHGYVTVNGEKMSKSRGTFIQAQTYLKHLDPEALRYYYASKLNDRIEDLDLNLDDFIAKVNSDIVNKVVNLASRNASFIKKYFDNQLSSELEAVEIFETFANAKQSITEFFEKREFNKAMREIMNLADIANKYVDEKAPWVLAKDETKKEELHQVTSMGIILFKILMTYLKPVMPNLAKKSEDFLNVELDWHKVDDRLSNHTLNAFKPLFARVDEKNVKKVTDETKEAFEKAQKENTKSEKKVTASKGFEPSPILPEISIDDFAKLDLRMAKVITCEEVPESKKLLKFTLDLGNETRTVFSGIKASYQNPSELNGRFVVMIANLAPRKMKFGLSEGMILSAGDDNQLFLLNADSGVQAGMEVK